jgi:hypothetical protein
VGNLEYADNTVFVTGVAKPSKDDPIASMYEVFFLSLVVDRDSGIIVDATCNTAREMTKDFIRSLLVRRNLAEGVDGMVGEIRRRFFGLAQKALIVALKDAHNHYVMAKSKMSQIGT